MSGVNTNVSSIKGGDRNESSNSGMLSSTGVRSDGADGAVDRKSTRLNSSHRNTSRMPSSA